MVYGKSCRPRLAQKLVSDNGFDNDSESFIMNNKNTENRYKHVFRISRNYYSISSTITLNVGNNLPNENSSNANELYESPSSLTLDENFNIENINENDLNLSKEQDSIVTKDSSNVISISDDDFLNQFPEINVNEGIITKKKSYSDKHRLKNIVDYAIENPNPLVIDSATSSNNSISSNSNNNSLKRCLNDLSGFNKDTENKITKKFKSNKNHQKNEALDDKNIFNNVLDLKWQSDQNEYNNILYNNLELKVKQEINIKKEDDKVNNLPFPNLKEGIDFDVNDILNRPQHNFRPSDLGDKRFQDYLIEQRLTTECIEQLYNSLTKIPKNTIERDPQGLTVLLMPHQKQALSWMKWREKQNPSGGILADDMGLGKTLEAISLILSVKNEQLFNGNVNLINDDSDDDWEMDDPHKTYNGKTLVVCLASLIKQWEREINTKCQRNKLSTYIYHGTSRIISEKKLSKFDIVLTTYNIIMKEHELNESPKKHKDSRIFKISWERVILDEAHYVRNHKSKMSISVCELTAKSKWALTGTPIQNKESDLYALLKFIKCSPFDDWLVWRRWVNNTNSSGNQRLIVITKSLMLRRTKDELISKDVIQQLPDKKINIINIKLDPEEKLVYQKLLLYSQSFFFEFLRQKKEKEHMKVFGCYSRTSLIAQEVPEKMTKLLKVLMRHHTQIQPHFILVLILRLRQMCCHPALIKSMIEKEDIEELEGSDLPVQNINATIMEELNKLMSDDEEDDESDDEIEYKIDEKMAKSIVSRSNPVFRNDRQSSKVRVILRIIKSIVDKGEKVIVVSQWTGFLDVIAKNLNLIKEVNYALLTGKVSIKDRQLIIDKLNDNDDRLNILLLSLTAGGVGLNLVGANNLLLVDLHWNPQLETQAQDRIYRFGQENNVHIYKFICKDSIEEKIKVLQDKKLEVAKSVLNGTVSNGLTIEDLKLLFS